MNLKVLRNKLLDKGLKITPQRLAVLKAVIKQRNHPTADNIIHLVHKTNPNIASGTIYKILETLVENKLITKVKTDKDVMRYDPILEDHHHLYCIDSERIEDYYDEELSNILKKYFEKKKIPQFEVENIKLQINGKFLNKK